jgi:predicted transcriptional regulator
MPPRKLPPILAARRDRADALTQIRAGIDVKCRMPPFDSMPASLYPVSVMEVDFTPEQEAQLAKVAQYVGTDTEHLVKHAALRMLDEDAEFRAGVRRGIEQADRGELIEHDDVKSRMARLLSR